MKNKLERIGKSGRKFKVICNAPGGTPEVIVRRTKKGFKFISLGNEAEPSFEKCAKEVRNSTKLKELLTNI